MAKNRMEEVAKLFGLELEEEFEIGKFEHYKFTVNGLMFWSKDHQAWVHYDITEQLLLGRYEIVKLSKPILTESEKEYLSAVIKPFRDRIIHIYKFELSGYEGIGIDLKFPKVEKNEDDAMTLPSFEIGTIYKGMELYKDYTLEELGL